jgi:hypothetical protein
MTALTVYDPRGLEFTYWASLMIELFADQNLSIPDPTSEEKWREWVLGLVGNGYFGQYEIPLPSATETWQEWAIRLLQSEINTGAA